MACTQCHKEMPPRHRKKYCSRQCRNKAIYQRIHITPVVFCSHCGKQCPVCRRKFCSDACKNESQQTWKYRKLFCHRCGISMPVNPKKKLYCSDRCRNQAWALRNGRRHRPYERKEIKTTCHCGKPIVHPRRHYCSDECWKAIIEKTKKKWRDKNPEKVKKYKLNSYYKKEKECPGYHTKKRIEYHNRKMKEDPIYRAKKREQWKRRDKEKRLKQMETQYGFLQLIIGGINADEPQE